MRKSMLMMLAMSMVAMGGTGMGSFHEPERRRRPETPPRKLTPEEELAEIDRRQAKFLLALKENNADRERNFPNWKQYEVYGLMITASNPKNARKNMNSLLHQNGIEIKENVSDPIIVPNI